MFFVFILTFNLNDCCTVLNDVVLSADIFILRCISAALVFNFIQCSIFLPRCMCGLFNF